MQRRTYTCAGIKGIDKTHQSGQNILPGKDLRTEILPAGIDNIDKHGNGLCTHDVNLEFLESLHIVQQVIEQRAENKQEPSAIKNKKELVEWDHVVQPAVNRMALLPRNQILSQEE